MSLGGYDHDTSQKGATQDKHHAPVEDKEGTLVKSGGKTAMVLLLELRIDYCDARPFCSALLELGYIFRFKVY